MYRIFILGQLFQSFDEQSEAEAVWKIVEFGELDAELYLGFDVLESNHY